MENSGRTVWQITVVIEATEEQRDAAVEAIARALCPDEHHPGQCEVPWTTMTCRLDDLSPSDRASWKASFDDDRRRAT